METKSRAKPKLQYKMSTWKLEVESEFSSEEKAIEKLADAYMLRSKCDAPNDHPLELMGFSSGRNIDSIAKHVHFFVKEKVYGHEQWVKKHILNIHPWKKEHWWPKEGFKAPTRKFKYEIVEPA